MDRRRGLDTVTSLSCCGSGGGRLASGGLWASKRRIQTGRLWEVTVTKAKESLTKKRNRPGEWQNSSGGRCFLENSRVSEYDIVDTSDRGVGPWKIKSEIKLLIASSPYRAISMGSCVLARSLNNPCVHVASPNSTRDAFQTHQNQFRPCPTLHGRRDSPSFHTSSKPSPNSSPS